jgi:hypothetical protein
MRTVVVGAGPVGLGVAYALGGQDCVVLEREPEAGGLCRSFTVGGATFDYGGHAFFTKHAEVDELLTRLAPNEMYRQPRNAWVYAYGTYVPYPFQSNLFGLPVDVVADCLLGAARQAVAARDVPPANLQEWIVDSFGAGIARHFLVPYNQKLWAHPLEVVEPQWTGERIVQPHLEDIVHGALSRRDYRMGDCHQYRRHGGPDQALYLYAREDADWWAAELGREIAPGYFGENLDTVGLDVSGALIGERWRIGAGSDAVEVEVRSPRTPCRNFALRMAEPDWIRRFAEARRPGAYLKVLRMGTVGAGDSVSVLLRPDHDVTVGHCALDPAPERMA